MTPPSVDISRALHERTRASRRSAFVVLCIIGLGVAISGVPWVAGLLPARCPICGRETQPYLMATVQVRGETRPVCCIRCAFSLRAQKGSHVSGLVVRDFTNGGQVSADRAWYVTNVPVDACPQHEAKSDQGKWRMDRVFDVCEPVILAFSTRAAAENLAKASGGTLRSYRELASIAEQE